MKQKSFIVKTIVLLLAALLISGCGGAESRKAKYLAKGKAYLEEKNYEKAKIEIKNALQIDPKNAEGYYLMGNVEEARQNWQASFGNYSKAVELNPDHLDARSRLARFYLLANEEEKAKQEIDAVFAKQADHVGALLIKALIFSKAKKHTEALNVLDEIIKTRPSEHEAFALKSAIYLTQKQVEKAIEVLQDGISVNPKNVALRLNLIQVYGGQRETTKVEELFQQCIALEPDNLQHRINLASYLARTDQAEKAEKTLRDAIKQGPEDEQRHLLLIDFLAKRKGVKAAEQELLAAIEENPEKSKLRFGLANLYEQMGDMSRSMDVYREIISRHDDEPEGLQAMNLLAEFSLRQGKTDQASDLTEKVLKENPRDNTALLMQARLLLLKRDSQGAIAALRTVLRDQPKLLEASLYLSDAHTMNKEPALAKETLLKAVEQNPREVKAHLALARYFAKNNDLDSAARKVDDALKLVPSDLEALQAKYELHVVKKDTKGAQSALEKIKSAHPENPLGYYQLGRLYQSQGKFDAAILEFEQALPRSKDGYSIMGTIVAVYLEQKKPEKAIARVNDLLAKNPASKVYAHELLAEIYITRKMFPEAEQALLKAVENNPKWNVPYRNLANLYMIRGDNRAAVETYQKGLDAIPDDTQLLLHVAEIYERTRDYEKAFSTYEHVLKLNPESDVAANNLASLLTDQKGDASSLKRARELAQRFETSPQPAYRDTLGWVYYKSGEPDKAVEILKEVVKQAPNVSIFQYHLGMAHHKQGNMAEAKTHLAKALEAKGEFTGKEEARQTLKKIQ